MSKRKYAVQLDEMYPWYFLLEEDHVMDEDVRIELTEKEFREIEKISQEFHRMQALLEKKYKEVVNE